MRLLLDTHAFIRAASAPEHLSPDARRAIEDPVNVVFISAAVSWEIAIKHSLGKLTLPTDPPTYVPTRIAALGFRPLPITQEHALAVWSLPKHHRDPFDRIMIAQAVVESLTFVTIDEDVLKYPVRVLRT